MIKTHVPGRLLVVARQEFEKRLQLKAVPSHDLLVQQVDDAEHQKGFELAIQFTTRFGGVHHITTCYMSRGILDHPNVEALMHRAGSKSAGDIWRNLHAQTDDPQH